MTTMEPDITRSALIIVDMQNDFIHANGEFAQMAKRYPQMNIDHKFLSSPLSSVKKLAEGFRDAKRPVLYIMHVLKPDYSDVAFPYWRHAGPNTKRTTVEGTWGAQIVDELTPQQGEHVIIKKGFGGFSNTPLDTILRNLGVTTCIVTGVTTCVCVSTTIRGGVEYNYRMIIVSDATAEIQKGMHEAELKTMERVFADIKTTGEVLKMLNKSI
jgi:nicotinamidase-related amidase